MSEILAKGPIVQGWCPGALRPMASGDGLVVRIRPIGGWLTQSQASGIAALSKTHGNGLIDLSNRANVQLRGVSEASFAGLIDGLRSLGLIDDTAEAEARRNIIVTPFWQQGDATQSLVAELSAALVSGDAPDLPAKFGFAIDTASTPVLRGVTADIWIETSAQGLLLATVAGAKLTTPQRAVADAIDLARWFLSMGGAVQGRGRMAQLLSRQSLPAGFDAPRAAAITPCIGMHPQGSLIGFEFGQMQADTLAKLAGLGALRLTPWRMVLVENTAMPAAIAGVITTPDDPMLRVIACTGAPACTQAHAATRPLARALAPHLTDLLHISGCAKGCAHPGPMRTLTATPVGFDLIHDGPASGIPARRGLSAMDLLACPSLLSKAP